VPEELTAGIPETTVGTAETVSCHRFTAPTGGTLSVWAGGVSMQNGGTVTGLKVEMYNHTDGVTEYSTQKSYERGNPVASAPVGGDDLEARVVNNSGTVPTSISGFVTFTV